MIIYACQIILCLLIFVRRLLCALHLKLTCISEREISKNIRVWFLLQLLQTKVQQRVTKENCS